jgi:hypothetical protein
VSQYDQDFAAAGFSVLLEYFGESALYTPPGNSPTSRTITVIVHRGAVMPAIPSARALAQQLTFEVLNDDTDGIPASDEPWKGGRLDVAPSAGGTVQSYLIHRTNDQDGSAGGVLHLALR